MIDAFLKWSSAAACKADPLVASHYDALSDLFAQDRVLIDPDVWRASQDVTNADGSVTHTFLSGFFLVISTLQTIPLILNAAALQFALDRDKCNARQAGMLVQNNLSLPLLADIRFSPVWAGADYPFGGIN